LAAVSYNEVDTVRVIRGFSAHVRWKFFSSDHVLSSRPLQLQADGLTWRAPYRPGSNDVTERFVGMVAAGARCLLAQSGWLAARWPYAARAFCHAKDVKIDYLVRVASTDGRVGTQMSETGRRVDVDLGWVLQCGGFFLDWVELAVLEPGDKSMVYRIKEVCVQNIPSRCAPLEVTHKQRMLMEKADDGNLDDLIDDPDKAKDVVPDEDVVDRSDLLALEQGPELADAPGAATEAPAREPGARRRAAANVNFNDVTQIEFEQDNPKRGDPCACGVRGLQDCHDRRR
jgi:hypothetical protein